MNSADLLRDHFDRITEIVNDAVEGLTPEQLSYRPDADANSIAWLVWHLTRVQDDHVADVAGIDQVWTSEGWARRFDLPFDDAAHGYGQSSEDVAKVKVESGDLLTGYLDAVTAQTKKYVATLTDKDLDRVVDTRWDPPVTLGVRLVSVIGDDLQHAGQASYIRGLIERL
ncbi:putative damage-inducible protein DinB [Antricoccus suffuscus]|uniref:Putative damage-inducible protein DinB n=1 Tax=Antricoccus suffuscus TaxID=1629062 RepID=A0A2T0ZJR6_9ACTN|nr:DinB family protein [Antricoccus suffuscus]PRZ36593.1 putative damage-inducible protein DinB [Antricoccus suffuscus]